ncbi:(2Fe-2S) ferredoxin domain-containing protein [Alienimonas chondri]|uniref:(2Fe-2S) ferredoxin domain-containing protein n=1 Tax=Alienimonas chondri TaxID=2681879 RepID=A0ABX1VD62_9PLAN|nr:(2Fe-2S) ferredoxin domain-containing protein [Alienimonas chondri]NNJ26049.1 hypothetical protein [Alienimonas chondri]
MSQTDDPDPKNAKKRDAAAKKADKLRLTDAAATVVLCCDTKESGCASAGEMKASWKALKALAKRAGKDGVRVALVKSACVDVCKFGPIAQVHSSVTAKAGHGGGAWYGGCDPATLERILAAHLSEEPDPTDCRLDAGGGPNAD